MQKIIASLALILTIGMGSMAILQRNFNALEKELTQLIYVAGPLNAASYETEINVNDIGLAVLKYLSAGKARYREWVEEDNRDFQKYHQTISRLAETPRQRALSEHIAVRSQEFSTLGFALMNERKVQEEVVARVFGQLEHLDNMIERYFDHSLASPGAHAGDSFRNLRNLLSLDAEAAEIGFWLANYRYRPSHEGKLKVENKLAAVQSGLASFRRRAHNAEGKSLGAALQAAVASTETNITTAFLLENDIHDGRERFIGLRIVLDEAFDDDLQPLLVQNLEVARRNVAMAAENLGVLSRQLMLFYLLAVIAAAYLLVRAIRPPLRRLIVGTRAIGKGDLSYRRNSPETARIHRIQGAVGEL